MKIFNLITYLSSHLFRWFQLPVLEHISPNAVRHNLCDSVVLSTMSIITTVINISMTYEITALHSLYDN